MTTKVYLEDFQGFHRVCKLVVCHAQDMCIVAALHHIPVRLHTANTARQLLKLAGTAYSLMQKDQGLIILSGRHLPALQAQVSD